MEKYINAEIEIIEIGSEDIITTSGGSGSEVPEMPIINP